MSLSFSAMTRKKVKLAFITNDAARKATFKKRKKGFLKKLTELTTLCGIQACAIIFSPFNSDPDIWPSPNGVQKVLSHFKTLPEMDQYKKMVNQESFIRHRIAKASAQLKKLQRDNREKEIAHIMFRCLVAGGAPPRDLNVVDLNDLGWMVDQKVADISKRIELLTTNQLSHEVAMEPGWFVDMVCQGGNDDQMGLNVGDDVIQFPSCFGEDENLSGFWSTNNAFFL